MSLKKFVPKCSIFKQISAIQSALESTPRPISINSRVLFRYTDKSPELCHEEDWPEGRFHSSYRIREDLTHEHMTENLRFVYLELGRFKKRLAKKDMLSDLRKAEQKEEWKDLQKERWKDLSKEEL